MNAYAHQWRLAVALKQPYPAPETGEVPQYWGWQNESPDRLALGLTQRKHEQSVAMGIGFGLAAALLVAGWLGSKGVAA